LPRSVEAKLDASEESLTALKTAQPACTPAIRCHILTAEQERHMPDMKAQSLTLHEGDKTALEYLGAAVVLQWSNLPEEVRKSLLQQADSVGGLPVVPELHERIQALIHRVRKTGPA
jgi:hypothetical protein